jgi:hypothetical protein
LLPLPSTCIEESAMKTNSKLSAGIKVNTGIKAGSLKSNHARSLTAIRVMSNVRAGAGMFSKNHSVRLLTQ